MNRTPLAIAVLLVPAAAWSCELRFAYTNQPAPPFISANAPDDALPGLAVDIVRAAAASIGCKAGFVRLPGKRVVAETAANVHSGMLMYSYTPERSALLVFPMADGKPDGSQRLARLSYYVYKMADRSLRWDGKELTHVDGAIGLNLGYGIGGELRALGLRVEEVPATTQNLEKLKIGRLAGYVMHHYAVDPLLAQPQYAGIERQEPVFSGRDYFVAFAPGYYQQNRAQVQKLWAAIARERERITSERLPLYGY
jgi:polar amino acid transport system substrate-binding protein